MQPDAATVRLISAAHCQRTVAGMQTADYEEAMRAIDNGCQLQQTLFILRYPEITLSDLGNPPYPMSLCDTDFIARCHRFIEKYVATKLQGTGVERITGAGLDTELAVCGPTSEGLHKVKEQLTSDLAMEMAPEAHMRLPLYHSHGIHPTRSVETLSVRTTAMLTNIKEQFAHYVVKEHQNKFPLYRLRAVHQNHQVWGEIATLAENKLFILGGGASLAAGYVNATDDTRVYFTEVHRENDPCRLYRTREFATVIPMPMPDGNWVIVDKVYTGGSITVAADRLRRAGIPKASITRVGFSPKSYASLGTLDYIVYAGRLLKCSDVLPRVNKNEWATDLLHIAGDRDI